MVPGSDHRGHQRLFPAVITEITNDSSLKVRWDPYIGVESEMVMEIDDSMPAVDESGATSGVDMVIQRKGLGKLRCWEHVVFIVLLLVLVMSPRSMLPSSAKP